MDLKQEFVYLIAIYYNTILIWNTGHKWMKMDIIYNEY